jgi:hypothetical protein
MVGMTGNRRNPHAVGVGLADPVSPTPTVVGLAGWPGQWRTDPHGGGAHELTANRRTPTKAGMKRNALSHGRNPHQSGEVFATRR